MAHAESWSEKRGREIIAAHQAGEGPLLPILHALQETFGHVPREAVPMVAEALNLSRAEVHGVVTFYHDFRTAPPGRHVLKVCRAEACQAMGSARLEALVQARLGSTNGTAADRSVTVEPVYCLGNCALAPSVQLDGKVQGRVSERRLDQILDACRDGSAGGLA